MIIRINCVYVLFFLLLLKAGNAQELTSIQQEYISQVIESLTQQTENSEDVSVVFDDLLNYLQNSLNLNTATDEELAELHILTAFQIAALIDYRKTHGDLLTIYELLYIPGFRQQEVDLITPFVICRTPVAQGKGFAGITSSVNQQVIVRYQRVLEKQKGYVHVNDSVLAVDPDKSRYLGSPDKLYLRYRMDMGKKLRAGLLMEKDAGEEFFGGSNPGGFDFYSGYIDYKNSHGALKRLILGDYHIQMGQGLLVWSSYSYGKSSYLSDMSRNREIIKANTSAEENLFFRGTAVTLGTKNISLTAFASDNRMDATLLSDTALADNYFSGFTTTGYHASPSDLEKENNVKLTAYGATLSYNINRLKLGINGIVTQTDNYLIEQDELYKAFYFSGNRNLGFSANYMYLGKKTQFFGELACSNQSFSAINGALFYLKPDLNLGILHRHYDKAYYSFWADAFRENSIVANEDGFYIGIEGGFSGNRFRIYSDIFSFPWLRYRVNAPSGGYEVFGEWEKTWGETRIYFRYKREEKLVNYKINENLYEVLPSIKEQYRINAAIPIGSWLALQNRLEISRAGFREDTIRLGFLVYQDIIVRSLPVPLDISIRIGYFNAEDYETRIYAYERDLLHAATSQMHYGKGWRYMLLLKWKPAEKLSFWLKIGQTRYTDKDCIGSGLIEIESNHRTEVKMQMIVKL